MTTIEYVTPNEMRATTDTIEALAAPATSDGAEDGCRYYASPEDFPKDKLWVFELIDGFQFNPKIAGRDQTWTIDADRGSETMLFRCHVGGRVVASRLVEWATFPLARLELRVEGGVIQMAG